MDLPAGAQPALDALLALLEADPRAPTSVREGGPARDVHVSDSLSGLEVHALAAARRIADVGAGAGFPGLVLAAALPDADVDLIESAARKCAFMRRAIGTARLGNARVVCERAETWAAAAGAGVYEAVTARAVGPLPTLVELAAPLLTEGGILVAWKGVADPAEEAAGARAAGALGMSPEGVIPVRPFRGSRIRHLHVFRKVAPTPAGIPRRPGMARKKPFGGERNS